MDSQLQLCGQKKREKKEKKKEKRYLNNFFYFIGITFPGVKGFGCGFGVECVLMTIIFAASPRCARVFPISRLEPFWVWGDF